MTPTPIEVHKMVRLLRLNAEHVASGADGSAMQKAADMLEALVPKNPRNVTYEENAFLYLKSAKRRHPTMLPEPWWRR